MGRKAKIDLVELEEMLRSGESAKECANHFGVGEPAISMARKKLNRSITQVVALEAAHEVVQRRLDIVDQLFEINARTREILDAATGEEKMVDDVVQAACAMIAHEGDLEKMESWIREAFKRIYGDDMKALKAVEAIRRQIEFQLKILQSLYDVEQMKEFQEEVLQAIGEVEPEVQNRIIERLNARRAVRAAVNVPQ